MTEPRVKKLQLYCPTCKKEVENFTAIYFIEGFYLYVKGECCGDELNTRQMPIIALFPDGTKEDKAN